MSIQGAAHIEYFTDLIFNDGQRGIDTFINITDQLIRTDITNNQQIKSVTIKIDGSPALFFGIDPLDNRFFISTKSVLNKEPILCKDTNQIRSQWKDNQKLVQILVNAFNHLNLIKRDLDKNVMYKGDILFSNNDISKSILDDQVIIQPNVIAYKVTDDKKYDEITKSEFGIIMHSLYQINRINKDNRLEIKPHCVHDKSFKRLITACKTKNIYIDDVFPTKDQFDQLNFDRAKIISKIDVVNNIIRLLPGDCDLKDDITKSGVEKLKTFLRKKLREGQDQIEFYQYVKNNDSLNTGIFSIFLDHLIDEFILLLSRKVQEKIRQNKSIKNKIKISLLVFGYFNQIQDMILQQLNRRLTKFDQKFINNDEIIESTDGEGFVINFLDDDQLKILKLVDRIQFTKLNALLH